MPTLHLSEILALACAFLFPPRMQLTLVREEFAKEKELLRLREGDFHFYRMQTEEFEDILIDQVRTYVRRVSILVYGTIPL